MKEPGKNILDDLSPDDTVKLWVCLGKRIARKFGNPYEDRTPNSTAFAALFGADDSGSFMEPRFKQLDTSEAEHWTVEEVRDWLFQQ